MASAVSALEKLAGTPAAFDMPRSELLPLQLAAANERFEDRVGKIKLLANRANTADIVRIRKPPDLVPLLFAHTAYKSYPESWLAEGKWERMGKWLETVSAYPVQGLNLDGVTTVDQWIEKLQTVGHYVTCSSGTTGKPAMLTCSRDELDVTGRLMVAAISWALGIEPKGGFRMMGIGGAMKAARIEATRLAVLNAFSSPDNEYQPEGPVITVGQVAQMILLRRKIADGTATPSEVAAIEQISASRKAAVEQGREALVAEFIASRGRKLFIGGQWPSLFPLAEGIRAKGYSAKDFNPGNCLITAGGLKGAVLPPDYKEIIYATLNLEPKRVYHAYSMQEINTQFPMCSAGRYHIPAWVMLLLLNDSGEELLDTGGGEIEGRAAFMDLSVDARWGGIISGDKVKANFGKCLCGHAGPTVAQEILRYADTTSGDKLACSGTIDAYIKGAV
jgi:hypothetical protein